MKLLNPDLSSMLNRRVEENDLILYPNLMHDGLENQVALFVVSNPLVISPFGNYVARHGTSCVVLCPLKFRAPLPDRRRKTRQENAFDPLVKFRDPLFKVCITFQVQPINLRMVISKRGQSRSRIELTAVCMRPRSSANAS